MALRLKGGGSVADTRQEAIAMELALLAARKNGETKEEEDKPTGVDKQSNKGPKHPAIFPEPQVVMTGNTELPIKKAMWWGGSQKETPPSNPITSTARDIKDEIKSVAPAEEDKIPVATTEYTGVDKQEYNTHNNTDIIPIKESFRSKLKRVFQNIVTSVVSSSAGAGIGYMLVDTNILLMKAVSGLAGAAVSGTAGYLLFGKKPEEQFMNLEQKAPATQNTSSQETVSTNPKKSHTIIRAAKYNTLEEIEHAIKTLSEEINARFDQQRENNQLSENDITLENMKTQMELLLQKKAKLANTSNQYTDNATKKKPKTQKTEEYPTFSDREKRIIEEKERAITELTKKNETLRSQRTFLNGGMIDPNIKSKEKDIKKIQKELDELKNKKQPPAQKNL